MRQQQEVCHYRQLWQRRTQESPLIMFPAINHYKINFCSYGYIIAVVVVYVPVWACVHVSLSVCVCVCVRVCICYHLFY